jgi:6-phosphogluconate dehydrogenase
MAVQAFGVIGLEVMGRNIALNIERNGFPIAVFNRTYPRRRPSSKARPRARTPRAPSAIEDFVKLLSARAAILMMVKAGEPPTPPSTRSSRSWSRATS